MSDTIKVINPVDGELVATYSQHREDAVEQIIARAHAAQRSWRASDLSRRASVLERAAALLRARADEYAALMAREMGKPVTQGRAELEKCAWVCEHYAARGEALLRSEPIETDARRSYVAYRPLGVVLAVMPWNFPFWQVFRFAAPALMAGNAGLLKHASNVPGSALAIESVLHDAGLPEPLFRALLIGSSSVAAVLEHPKVAAATLTGSGPAGRAVASTAGEQIKKTVLELGGSDPYLVLEDAALDAAVETCVNSRLINSGQSCIAGKRFIVHEAVYDDFVARFVAAMKRRRVGDPLDERTDVGPMARRELRDELHAQVTATVEAGARCLLGGQRPEGAGAFYPPTVLVDVPKDSPGHREELFGPVAAVFRVDSERAAIELANDTPFGLGAAVFTGDLERGRRIAELELEAGCCFVNEQVKSDPRLPFGGIKQSGYGRELAADGIRAFVNQKTVYVA